MQTEIKKLFEHVSGNSFRILKEQPTIPAEKASASNPPTKPTPQPSIPKKPDQGIFYSWTKDFEIFQSKINSATEEAKNTLEKSLKAKVLNKPVLIRASKAQPKQPEKDYNLNKVVNVYLMNYNDEWVVVFKDEFDKEFCLKPGFKIKLLGQGATPEPGAAQAPTPESPELKEPKSPTIKSKPIPQAPKPTRPVKTQPPPKQ